MVLVSTEGLCFLPFFPSSLAFVSCCFSLPFILFHAVFPFPSLAFVFCRFSLHMAFASCHFSLPFIHGFCFMPFFPTVIYGFCFMPFFPSLHTWLLFHVGFPLILGFCFMPYSLPSDMVFVSCRFSL